MAYLIFIFITIALFAGFIFLTRIEAKRGTRFFSAERARLDTQVLQATFLFEHVDFAAFVRAEAKAAGESMLHEVVHVSLAAVRSAERLLTRAVKELRVRHESLAAAPARESTRPFVKTLSNFKAHLQSQRPQETVETSGIE